MKTASEILLEYFPNTTSLNNETGERIIDAMEKYADQFKTTGIIESIIIRLDRIETILKNELK